MECLKICSWCTLNLLDIYNRFIVRFLMGLMLLPNPLTLASGVSPIFPLVVQKQDYLANRSITPAGSVHKSRGDNVVRMWLQLKR